MGPDGKWVEVQIRTKRMDDIAEKGFAAHWKYKENSKSDNKLDKWINNVREFLDQNDSSALELLEDFKSELYNDEVFVFTPKGDLITLPFNSTVLDFAFAIHSDIGSTCVRAKVNKKLVPLSYTLTNGDIVEVETDKNQKPNSGWLNFVKTSRASHVINKYLRKIEIEESIKIGNELLEKGL